MLPTLLPSCTDSWYRDALITSWQSQHTIPCMIRPHHISVCSGLNRPPQPSSAAIIFIWSAGKTSPSTNHRRPTIVPVATACLWNSVPPDLCLRLLFSGEDTPVPAHILVTYCLSSCTIAYYHAMNYY